LLIDDQHGRLVQDTIAVQMISVGQRPIAKCAQQHTTPRQHIENKRSCVTTPIEARVHHHALFTVRLGVEVGQELLIGLV
jgi:hypothetical protein